MAGCIDITSRFPATRERTVLLELLRLVQNLRSEGIEVVICGGWVPFLKQLARENETAHSMSLDIDLLFREAAREGEAIDKIRAVLIADMEYARSATHSFRYEKEVEGNIVQLDLLTDLPRDANDEPIRRVQGRAASLEVCAVDGAEDLANHVESIQINWLEGNETHTCEISIPDPVGFLLLKVTVCRYREEPKDPYDIYYYCRFSETADLIRQRLGDTIGQSAIRRTVDDLRRMFRYEDSKWVDMALDHMGIVGEERDREARFIVRSVMKVIEDL